MTPATLLSGIDAAIALKLAEFRQMPTSDQRVFFELGFIAGLQHKLSMDADTVDKAITKITEG